jgi:1-acyl-sn-glycerol-3-phosphate acyltransferase
MFFKKYMNKKFSKLPPEHFGKFRAITYWLILHVFLGSYMRFLFKIEVIGKEKLKTKKPYLVAANHFSGWDPFIIAMASDQYLAFMAKEELFKTFFSRWLMDWCGAFAVNRSKLEVSTIKTALAVNKTFWKIAIFPQGTRDSSGKINKVSKGFVSLAKSTKADIIPVSITYTNPKSRGFHKETITIKVGDPIPYEDVNTTIQKWCSAISELSGLTYEPAEA